MSMSVEQIEIRRIISQMLADEGINRNTINDIVKEVISEKVDNCLKNYNRDSVESIVEKYLKPIIEKELREQISNHTRELMTSFWGGIKLKVEIDNKWKDEK